jgi:hypothetical protein
MGLLLPGQSQVIVRSPRSFVNCISTAGGSGFCLHPAGLNRGRREYRSKTQPLIKYLSLQYASKPQKKTGCAARYYQSLSKKMTTWFFA